MALKFCIAGCWQNQVPANKRIVSIKEASLPKYFGLSNNDFGLDDASFITKNYCFRLK